MKQKRDTHANQTPGMAWQIGKTEASVDLYNKIMHHMLVCNDQEEEERELLKKILKEIKNGERVINQCITSYQFLHFLEEEKLCARNRT